MDIIEQDAIITDLPAPLASARPTYEAVAAKIIGIINVNGLKPGDRLPTERALSDEIHVSRTVIREALNMLAISGLVQARRGSGHYVTSHPQPMASAALNFSLPIDPEHILALFDFRCMLEVEAVRRATERITLAQMRELEAAAALTVAWAGENSALFGEGDTRFHLGLAEASGNPFLAATVGTVHRLQRVAIDMAIAHGPGSYTIAGQEHQAILDALRSGRTDEAVEGMQRHILRGKEDYQREVREMLAGLRNNRT